MKKFAVLVIGDNPDNGTSLHEILVTNDLEVKTVTTGIAGLSMLNDGIFDLVFIEADNPDINSLTICSAIRKNQNLNAIPVVFIFERPEPSIVREMYESGGDDYILRPLVKLELLIKARFHLEVKYSRKIAKNMNQMLEDRVAKRTVELEDSLKKLEKAKKELEKLSIAKSEFLNMISHEIRTPLNGILGSLALIGRYNFTDEVNRYFSLLDASVKRLEKFSNIILEATALRLKGEKILEYRDTDIIKILHDALGQCTEKYVEKGLQIEFQNETTNSSLRADGNYLLKCFLAVLDNAFKFSPQGEKLYVKVKNEAPGYLKITVADRGNGFSKAALDNIYDPLSNIEAHFDQNTGMGLHLAKLVLEAHSGFISAGNGKQAGAVIEIMIPSGN
jgi:two-component system sensor histidine kinase/response regulator